MKTKEKPGTGEIVSLYSELNDLEGQINPKPDPETWPPPGWVRHPQAPDCLYRVVRESDLREEIFGSPEKTEWIEWAKKRVAEIRETLVEWFFPKPKEEGIQRNEKAGFAVMLKTGMKREFDLAALASVVAECQAKADKAKLGLNVENKVIEWVPKLKLKEYRELPPKIRAQFDAALILTPAKPEFEIVRIADLEDGGNA